MTNPPSRTLSARSPEHALGRLVDPANFAEALDVGDVPGDKLARHLEMMMRIRVVEEVIGELVRSGDVKCPCHLGIGQEAVAVGATAPLRSDDRVFGTHRAHGQYLALGCGVEALIAEVLGRVTGCSKGMGGSMHLHGGDRGFHGSVPIVAGTVPVAVGAGLSARLAGLDSVAVAFFGDGACEEGVVHESLNLASTMRLPVIFVVENNLYSSHLDILLRQPSDRLGRFGEAHDIETRTIDGNDVVAVEAAMTELVERARRGAGPGFLEVVTYRWRGHVGPNEDIDVGVRRSSVELAAWRARDPVRRLVDGLIRRGDLTEEAFAAVERRVRDEVSVAREAALNAPWPEANATLDLVLAP